jgi:hypothetical protein
VTIAVIPLSPRDILLALTVVFAFIEVASRFALLGLGAKKRVIACCCILCRKSEKKLKKTTLFTHLFSLKVPQIMVVRDKRLIFSRFFWGL